MKVISTNQVHAVMYYVRMFNKYQIANKQMTCYILEMQRYIDISSYRDTLGSDTVSIHI